MRTLNNEMKSLMECLRYLIDLPAMGRSCFSTGSIWRSEGSRSRPLHKADCSPTHTYEVGPSDKGQCSVSLLNTTALTY